MSDKKINTDEILEQGKEWLSDKDNQATLKKYALKAWEAIKNWWTKKK